MPDSYACLTTRAPSPNHISCAICAYIKTPPIFARIHILNAVPEPTANIPVFSLGLPAAEWVQESQHRVTFGIQPRQGAHATHTPENIEVILSFLQSPLRKLDLVLPRTDIGPCVFIIWFDAIASARLNIAFRMLDRYPGIPSHRDVGSSQLRSRGQSTAQFFGVGAVVVPVHLLSVLHLPKRDCE